MVDAEGVWPPQRFHVPRGCELYKYMRDLPKQPWYHVQFEDTVRAFMQRFPRPKAAPKAAPILATKEKPAEEAEVDEWTGAGSAAGGEEEGEDEDEGWFNPCPWFDRA